MRRDRHRQCWSHCYQSLMTVRPLSHRTGCNQARSRSLVVGVCTGGSFVRRCRAQAPYTRTIMTRCRSVPHYTFAPLPLVCRFAGFQYQPTRARALSLSLVQHRCTTSRLSKGARYASLMKFCSKPTEHSWNDWNDFVSHRGLFHTKSSLSSSSPHTLGVTCPPLPLLITPALSAPSLCLAPSLPSSPSPPLALLFRNPSLLCLNVQGLVRYAPRCLQHIHIHIQICMCTYTQTL